MWHMWHFPVFNPVVFRLLYHSFVKIGKCVFKPNARIALCVYLVYSAAHDALIWHYMCCDCEYRHKWIPCSVVCES